MLSEGHVIVGRWVDRGGSGHPLPRISRVGVNISPYLVCFSEKTSLRETTGSVYVVVYPGIKFRFTWKWAHPCGWPLRTFWSPLGKLGRPLAVYIPSVQSKSHAAPCFSRNWTNSRPIPLLVLPDQFFLGTQERSRG